MTKQNLTPKMIIEMLERHGNEINRYGVKKIGLFGSFLNRKEHKKSDIDFLVLFDKPTFDNYIELKFMLQKLFHKKVDLVIEENLKPSLKYVKEEALYAKGL